MKNYAGHRLSPWLGHLMVSRQETARPLMTPGEVMQLPATDELVMVSGMPPIRARKARYFDDPRLNLRVLPPPRREVERHSRAGPWNAVIDALPPDGETRAPNSVGGGLGIELEVGADEAARDGDPPLADEEAIDAAVLKGPSGPGKPERRNARAARLAAMDPDDEIPM
jgi:type IV secretion system protein VirD4